MAFCTAAQVGAIVDTDMTPAEITDLITEVQALMTAMLSVGSINATILQAICRRWTALNVMQKDPNARSLGQHSENRSDTMKGLWEQVQYMIMRAEGGIRVQATREELS